MLWVFFAFLAGVLTAEKVIISKQAMENRSVSEYLFWCSFIFLFFLLVFHFSGGLGFLPSLEIPKWDILILGLCNGILATMSWIFLYSAYKHMHLSEVAPLTNLVPIVLAGMGFLFLGEVLKETQIIGIAIIVLAAYLIEHTEAKHGLNFKKILENKYFEAALLYVFIISLVIIIEKLLVAETNISTIMFMEYLSMLVLSFLYIKIIEKKKVLGKIDKPLFLSSLVGFFSSAFYFFALAIPTSLVSLIIPVKRFETVLITFFGGTKYKEEHIKEKVLLSLAMVVGIYLIVAV